MLFLYNEINLKIFIISTKVSYESDNKDGVINFNIFFLNVGLMLYTCVYQIWFGKFS